MRTLCSLISLLLFMQTHGFSQYCFNCGEGSLGDFHAAKDTTVLSGTYEFDHFIIDAGVRVKVIGSTALIIRCKGDVQIHGILDLSGENGEHASSNLTPGMGGIGFAGAFSGANGLLALSTATPGTQGQGPGAGPGGWNGAGSGAGYGQPGTGCAVNGGLAYGDSLLHQLYGGSGGGSGASLPGGSSGGGGAGGGILVIHSCQVIQISSSGSILCRGGNGGNGFGSGFAGGGGSGGSILLASKSVLVEGIVDADGGQGGMSSAGGPCQLGGTGAPGRIRINAQETSFNGAIYPSPLIRQLFNAGIRRVVNAKCNGSASGFLKARASGGDRPYTFQWSDGSSTEEIRQLAAGTYTVTITESSGCSVTESVEVGQPDPILTEVVSYPPSCESLQNGQAIFKSSGGHPFPHHGALSTTFWSNNSSHGIMFDFSVNTTLNLKKISLSLPFNGPQRISIFFRMGSMNGFENDSTQWQLISHSLV
ncbi:MAG: SprB repeat-containing protein, partial [Bacteroidia bacterium]|nr:SprB repeat-containing protein [Bacteroidia bacterium]